MDSMIKMHKKIIGCIRARNASYHKLITDKIVREQCDAWG